MPRSGRLTSAGLRAGASCQAQHDMDTARCTARQASLRTAFEDRIAVACLIRAAAAMSCASKQRKAALGPGFSWTGGLTRIGWQGYVRA